MVGDTYEIDEERDDKEGLDTTNVTNSFISRLDVVGFH